MMTKEKIQNYLSEKFKSANVLDVKELGSGVHGTGYLIKFIADENGRKVEKRLVMKGLEGLNFGHDYACDRAQVLLLANACYNKLPNHVKATDVVGESKDALISLGNAHEFYLLMEEAKGESYFEDLNKIFQKGIDDKDREKAKFLAKFLAGIHKKANFSKEVARSLYRRKIRDTIGHGECLMGVIDIYEKENFLGINLTDIVCKAVERWGKFKDKSERLAVIHGDFHPGNIWFGEDNAEGKGRLNLTVLDRSRGEYGDAADDISCFIMNYIHYSIRKYGKLDNEFKELTKIFTNEYLKQTNDYEIFEVMSVFFAFRSVVVANPLFYKDIDEVKIKLLKFGRNVLDYDKFEIEKVNDMIE
ncbi:MAG: aminoglycoside phosphotransferase family protein [Candidatus Altiarchaeum hamiconexum]|uniref:Aminoglycoside phosphotransferase family protein n=1 Tax=Candidatus Altarchaeum hamiconexum TaxID=1803513 RepID=A0A8J8CEW4_9ARCH|nr:aminoglycoside phosphotransferase family protein [Candidatus Altarchaeum hamiconexum]PIV28993.1 MAG: aminoglycoside phosphotransferase [Candidatus Altarchaeum sp. CG03_land_8_20_14_0_80_32_618]PJC13959.1 MAG: aminoglycoside phosphotransferase [Candidatus Altarchaeum sp. CG_4_9_14_0_8_um_filter_32_206]NCN68773.1 aminoglycoside phosphotransferase family protein [Candidatus Altarchaeum hamiconexum]NCS91208.1 aminoglycoside phosphotransferase family protein [Candidatus Altarchaeum hamiconexum]